MTTRMPALFIGHGNPMNTLADNRYTAAWRHLGETLPRPKAILSVSAHWYTRGIGVTAMQKPRTIHDFYGFPPELFAIEYPAPGDAALASRVRDLLAPLGVALDTEWGLDHGTWSVLVHLYPNADIPVVQLSIDATQPPAFHYALGGKLQSLRDEGVLIFGSGNVVHNLGEVKRAAGATPFDWASQFEGKVRDCIQRGDHSPLIDYEKFGRGAELSMPTPEHYLPLLYVLGAQGPQDTASIPIDGIDLGSISMLSVLLSS
jgi:4,5-DOPA dioxygenase extradiol